MYLQPLPNRSKKSVKNTKYERWRGLAVGKASHHGRGGRSCVGKQFYDHDFPLDEGALRNAIISWEHACSRVLRIVDQTNSSWTVTVAFARDCDADVVHLPDMRCGPLLDLILGQAKTAGLDAIIVVDTTRSVPHTVIR